MQRSIQKLAIALGACSLAAWAGREPNPPKVADARATIDEHGVIYLAVAFKGDGTVDYVHANDVCGAELLAETRGTPIALQLQRDAESIDVVLKSRGNGGDEAETHLEIAAPKNAAAGKIAVRVR
jgi:hypothetical protein